MKPDIVFFGENLGEAFHRQLAIDKDDVDLLIIMGSSMKVRQVALIPGSWQLMTTHYFRPADSILPDVPTSADRHQQRTVVECRQRRAADRRPRRHS